MLGMLLVAVPVITMMNLPVAGSGPIAAGDAMLAATVGAPPEAPAITPGTNRPAASCLKSLQAIVDAASTRSTLSVPACIYRETVTIDMPLTLVAQPGAEIRGSQVWTGCWRIDRLWVKGTRGRQWSGAELVRGHLELPKSGPAAERPLP